MIEILIPLVKIALVSAISIGVGASTLVIASFLTALYDDVVDASERRMLGVIYWLLRWAMGLILVTAAFLTYFDASYIPNPIFQWIMITVLFVNAILMTYHIMPVKFGPAIQAATWYTLGFHFTIDLLGLYDFTTQLFLILYTIDFIVVFALVNGWLWYVKTRSKQ